MPADLVRLRLNGTATDSQFAQNPIPVIQSMGWAMAEVHAGPTDGLVPQTPFEVDGARAFLTNGGAPPSPFLRVRPETILTMLETPPAAAASRPVRTHGTPIASAAALVDSRTTFTDAGTWGLDPAERDLSIVLRSLAETFAGEATLAFLDAYVAGGGALPDGPTLDWYGMVAAFR